jgi:ribosomal-protein-alanine N-acetyltransferase
MIARGVEMVTLEMRPSNKLAYKLYQKYGFCVVQFRRQYYRDGEDAWVMAVRMNESYRERLTELRDAVKERFERQDIEVGQINGDPL